MNLRSDFNTPTPDGRSEFKKYTERRMDHITKLLVHIFGALSYKSDSSESYTDAYKFEHDLIKLKERMEAIIDAPISWYEFDMLFGNLTSKLTGPHSTRICFLYRSLGIPVGKDHHTYIINEEVKIMETQKLEIDKSISAAKSTLIGEANGN